MQIKAPAKINLALDILKKDKSGYHRIQTVLQEIPLYDILTFKKTTENSAKIIITSNKSLPDYNTVFKAAEILKKYTSKNAPSIKIHIQKNIPISSGLGGGSSDAAATLKALNKIWKLKLSTKKLQKIATKIGKDAPFFIKGGTALATNYGEKIHQLPKLKLQKILLIFPKPHNNKNNKTAHAYKQISGYKTGQNKKCTTELVQKIKQGQTKNIELFFHNDFNLLYKNSLQKISNNLFQKGALTVNISGSGHTIYAIFKDIPPGLEGLWLK